MSGRLTQNHSDPRDQLERLLPPGALDAIEALVEDIIEQRVAAAAAAEDDRDLLTVDETAARLSCTPAAVRMRISRGRLDVRHHGRRVYVTRESLERLER